MSIYVSLKGEKTELVFYKHKKPVEPFQDNPRITPKCSNGLYCMFIVTVIYMI